MRAHALTSTLHKEEAQNESRSAPDEDYCRWWMALRQAKEESEVGTFSRNVELEHEREQIERP